MYFSYGNFNALPSDNFRYTGGRIDSKINNGRLESVIVSLDFAFTIHGNETYLTTRMAQIRAAIKNWGFDVGLRHDDGTPSAAFIVSAQTSSGTRITRYPFPEAAQNEGNFASGLRGACSFQAEYLPQQFFGGGGGGGGSSVVVGYSQVVTTRGTGGPRRLTQEFAQGAPAEYIVADQTKCYATQAGQVVTEASAPDMFGTPIGPLWPSQLISESYQFAKANEQINNDKWRCTLGWSYEFESIGPFS